VLLASIAQHVIDAISLGSMYALAALGIGLIFGVMRLINFAHGDLVTIGAYALIIPSASATATLFIGNFSPVLMALTIVGIVALLALAIERIAFRPIREANPSTLLISSFAVSYFLQNSVLLIYSSRPKSIDVASALNQQLTVEGLRIPLLDIVTIMSTTLLLGAAAFILKKTRVGIQMRAASEDFAMARLLGVRANAVIALAFALSGIMAGALALLLVAKTGLLSYRMGVPLVLYAFIGTVIGGMGSLIGPPLGGFLLGIVSVALQIVLPIEWRSSRDAVAFALVILILLIRPRGLIQVPSIKERV
jgi:branched-chain amino acid transport system permease protein